MFDGPHPQGGGDDDWFFIEKTLAEDVQRACSVSVTFDGRVASFTTRERLPKGTVVRFAFAAGIVSVTYELAPGERRYLRGNFA